jgi:heptosyltransferase-2
VVANTIVAELFKDHPDCDHVLVFDKHGEHKGKFGFLRFCSTIRKHEFDLAILFQNAIEAAIMAFLAGVPGRAGYRSDGRGFLLTHPVPLQVEDKFLHHTDYYLEMLRKLGVVGEQKQLRLNCTDIENKWAEEMLGKERWVAVNPGAAYGDAKRWFPERFALVGDRLQEEFGVRLVLTGGPNEVRIGSDIESFMANKPLNMIGKTTVRQLMALLSRCALVVTNDSGPMHIAAAFGVPIVAVFGPTDHTTTSPLAEDASIVRKEFPCSPCLLRKCPADHGCMEAITAEDVLEAARSLLKQD